MEKTDKKNNKLFNFLSNGKNVAILILSLILFCIIITYPDIDTTVSTNSSQTIEELNSKINELNIKNNDLEQQLEDVKQQLTNLQNTNDTLEEEKQKLENEKNELTTKIENLEKTLSSKTNTSNNSNSNKTYQSNTSTVSSSTTSQQSNSQMVWVGDTGTKYHKQSCRTLKGNGHQITMEQALAEGREACKVCY